MPTAYGEGQESARSRLQDELEGASNAPSIIPFSRNSRFVGRESQLAELEAKLFSNAQTTTTLAITGPGGTGKSQLALEVAHRTRQNNKDCSVFWMDASDKDSLYQSYASVAQKLSVLGWDDEQVDMKRTIHRCVAEMSARQCLLIFDNTEETTLRSGRSSMTRAAELADYLPQSKLCSVIFTTTNSSIAKVLTPQSVIVLEELTPDVALKLLQTRLSTPLSNTEQQEAKHLLKELSHLPLAVAQAAACMNAGGITIKGYRLQLDEHKELALEYSGAYSEGTILGPDVRDPVAATLLLSVNQVRHNNALAADYLFFAACVEWKDISLDLLEAASTQAREDAIRVLDKYALVTRRPAESALDFHRLVHQALQRWLHVQGKIKNWTQRTIATLFHVFPDDDHSNKSKCRRLLPHAQYALSHSSTDDDEERLGLALKCSMALHSDGRYGEAEELEVEVMWMRKRLLSDEHPDTLTSMNNLASTYWNQGRWREAEELFVQVMQTRKRVLTEEHPRTLLSMDNLAATYRNQGRWKEAKELQEQAIQTRKRLLTNEHPDTLISIGNLASTYCSQGRWKEAEDLQVQVVETSKRVLGDEHPSTLTSMANLALTYRNQGRSKEAEELEVQVMETRKRLLTDEHPDTLTSMNNLAFTLQSQARRAV